MSKKKLQDVCSEIWQAMMSKAGSVARSTYNEEGRVPGSKAGNATKSNVGGGSVRGGSGSHAIIETGS